MVSTESFTSVTRTGVPEGYHYESKPCPNVGRACNCPGTCLPRLVRDQPAKPPMTFTRPAQPSALERIADQLLAANWIAVGEVGKAIELMTK